MALSGEKAEDAEAALALQKEPWPAQEAFGAQGLRHEEFPLLFMRFFLLCRKGSERCRAWGWQQGGDTSRAAPGSAIQLDLCCELKGQKKVAV